MVLSILRTHGGSSSPSHSVARPKLDTGRNDYNQRRPHSALADRTPDEFASVATQFSAGLSPGERAEALTQEAVCVERFK
jgi:hypothetical protein